MYRTNTPGQLSFENFYLPFGGKLSGDNRWVKLAELVPWQSIESGYAEHFSEDIGATSQVISYRPWGTDHQREAGDQRRRDR